MQIFVTNLKGFDKRKKWMVDQLGRHQLKFDFIDCVDGRNWSREEIQSIVSPELFELYKNNDVWLTKGAIAATKTHLDRIYERMCAENIDFALCLEDDVLLANGFKESLLETLGLLENDQHDGVVLLHYFLKTPTKLSALSRIEGKKVSVYHLAEKPRIGSGAAYIISRNTAKKILETQNPIQRIADWWGDHPGIQVSITHPMLAQTGVFTSTLGYSKKGMRKILSALVPDSLKRIIRMKKLAKLEAKNILP